MAINLLSIDYPSTFVPGETFYVVLVFSNTIDYSEAYLGWGAVPDDNWISPSVSLSTTTKTNDTMTCTCDTSHSSIPSAVEALFFQYYVEDAEMYWSESGWDYTITAGAGSSSGGSSSGGNSSGGSSSGGSSSGGSSSAGGGSFIPLLDGYELVLPANISNANYLENYIIVKGKQATTLTAGVVECGVIRKKTWLITFLSRDIKENILGLVGSNVPFVDAKGGSYTVCIKGPVQCSPYPFSEIATMTIELQEV